MRHRERHEWYVAVHMMRVNGTMRSAYGWTITLDR